MDFIQTYADQIASAKRDLVIAKENEKDLVESIQKHVYWTAPSIGQKMQAAVHYILKKDPYSIVNVIHINFWRKENNPDVGFAYIDEYKDRFGSGWPIKVVELKHIRQLRVELPINNWQLAVEKNITQLGAKEWKKEMEKTAPLKYLETCKKLFPNQFYKITHPKLKIRNIIVYLPKF